MKRFILFLLIAAAVALAAKYLGFLPGWKFIPGQRWDKTTGIVVRPTSQWNFVKPEEGDLFTLQSVDQYGGSRILCHVGAIEVKEGTNVDEFARDTLSLNVRFGGASQVGGFYAVDFGGGGEGASYNLESGGDEITKFDYVSKSSSLIIVLKSERIRDHNAAWPAIEALRAAIAW